ncbi:Uncharacterised protein [Burkholderia pseudomallei]|nr:Uncharacterised protein [Burkholderia pseudomallei]
MRARHALKAHACRADAAEAEAEAAKRATPIHARRAGPLPSPATIMRAAPLVTMHHDVRRRKRTHSVPRLPAFPPSRLPAFPPSRLPAFQPSSLPAFQPSSLPAFQPSSLPAFQPSSLPAFQDDRRAPPLFFRHAPSRSASRMSPRLGAIAHDPPVARDSIRAADAGRAASPEPRSRAAPRKTGQRNAPPVAPPTCRHADMPTCRTAATAATAAAARRNRSSSLGKRRSRIRTRPPAFHRRSIGVPSALRRRARRQRTLNAERARSRRPARRAARRAANARAIEPPHRASRHPGLLLNAFNPWITPSSARPCSSEPSHASTIASRNKSLYGADNRAACRASTP